MYSAVGSRVGCRFRLAGDGRGSGRSATVAAVARADENAGCGGCQCCFRSAAIGCGTKLPCAALAAATTLRPDFYYTCNKHYVYTYKILIIRTYMYVMMSLQYISAIPRTYKKHRPPRVIVIIFIFFATRLV